MELIVVKEIPKLCRAHTPEEDLIDQLIEFKKSEANVVRVDYDISEFGTQSSVYSAVRRIIKREGFRMKAVAVRKEVYIAKI